MDATFRTIPERKGRAMIGHSMGGYGVFRYGLLHKDKFCAFAANGAEINFHLFTDNIHAKVLIENSGPPYSYSYQGGGPFTRWMFLFAGAAAPNLNTPQTYINPAIVEYPYNEYCEPIDTIWQKFHSFDILPLLHNTLPEDSVGILYCCGMADQWGIYEANAALADTLDALGLPYEFMSHTGGHGMPNAFKERALTFLDSLLMSPIQVNVGINEISNSLKSFEIYPNPFLNATTMRFELYHSTDVKITLHNSSGQLISKLSEGLLQPGWHDLSIEANNLKPGIYFLLMQTGEKSLTRKLVKY